MKKKAPTRKKTNRPPRESAAARKQRAEVLIEGLKELYPDAHCELDYANAWELLMATILSAQCTDVRVNLVTPNLFAAYPGPEKLARAPQEKVEEIVRSTGFYRNKAKSLVSSSADIVENFGGAVPQTMEELLTLRGVARKTANVVLSNAFGINEGVVVDTHVNRLANRMALSRESNPVRLEKDLVKLCPQEDWGLLSHLLIWHGRRVCSARSPDCASCTLRPHCPRVGLPAELPT